MTTTLSLSAILKNDVAAWLEAVLAEKAASPVLGRLNDPEEAERFLNVNLRGSYLFARYAVPAFASAIFASLSDGHPPDDGTGRLLAAITEAVSGELFNNNVFRRRGECHSHFHDLAEAFEAAVGNRTEVQAFLRQAERGFGPESDSAPASWSSGSRRFAWKLRSCCRDPLAILILMSANEILTPAVYAKALGSLSQEARFDAFRTFLCRHVELDQDDHGPATLRWLQLRVDRLRAASPDTAERRIEEATWLVLDLYDRA